MYNSDISDARERHDVLTKNPGGNSKYEYI